MKKIALIAVAVILTLFILFLVGFRKSASGNHIILITIDTVRFDHLGSFGYSKNTSPNIDRLALSGVKFTNCFSTMPVTDPSHVSILTSSYPRTHGVLKNGMEISNPDVLCIAKWLKEKGYMTAAITARVGLDPNLLKLEGFDYVNAPPESVHSKPAEEIYAEAVAYIDQHADKDFFLWVHFFDAHMGYKPPAPYNAMFNNGFRGYVHKPYQFLSEDEESEWTDDEIEYNVSLYDGAIRYMDAYIGKLLDHLNERLSKPPLIVLVADHGETLGELKERYGYVFDHGEFLYNREIRIPLIMSWKGKLPEGKTIDALVESIDIAPTIVDLLYGKKLSAFWGTSLRNLIFGRSTEARSFAFSQRRTLIKAPRPYLIGEQFAVMSPDYKLIYNPVKGVELYQAGTDEIPQNDLSAIRPDMVDKLMEELEEWEKDHKPAPVKLDIPESRKKQLEALGYVF